MHVRVTMVIRWFFAHHFGSDAGSVTLVEHREIKQVVNLHVLG